MPGGFEQDNGKNNKVETTMRRRYFTLVELLAVMVVIIVLAGITVGGIMFATGKADSAKTVSRMTEFEAALEEYKNDYGVYPIYPTDKKASGQRNYAGCKLDLADAAWDKFMNRTKNKKDRPYINADDAEYKDGFDNVFFYSFPNNIKERNSSKYVLWSMGNDGYHGNKSEIEDVSGTSDDDVLEARTDAGAEGSDDICSWKLNQ